jgi:hypothetical protein
VVGASSFSPIDGVAVETRRGDEAAFGMVGIEDLHVGPTRRIRVVA